MGLLGDIAGPLADRLADSSTLAKVSSAFAAFIVLSVVFNVLGQLLVKKADRPPVVFHWFPWIGSTVTYGMDPFKFFSENRRKVGVPLSNCRAPARC